MPFGVLKTFYCPTMHFRQMLLSGYPSQGIFTSSSVQTLVTQYDNKRSLCWKHCSTICCFTTDVCGERTLEYLSLRLCCDFDRFLNNGVCICVFEQGIPACRLLQQFCTFGATLSLCGGATSLYKPCV